MAIRPTTRYSGNVIATDAAYPLGKAKNVTSQDDGTGTPLEAAWLNDLWGFLQALLAEAAIDASGDPDTATASQYLQAIQALINTAVGAVEASQGLNAEQVQQRINASISQLIDGAPQTLDTLNELAAALNDQANFGQAIVTALAAKAALNSPDLTGTPTAPTPNAGDDSTKIATTAFVAAAILAAGTGGGTTLPPYLQTETLGLFSRAGNLLWEVVNQVPDTPGEASAIGHVLQVYGENDQDYRWGPLNVASAVASAVADYFRDNPQSGIEDGSITPVKTDATDGPKRKAWRARFGSVSLTAGADLPAAADANERDLHYFPQDVAAGGTLAWRDVLDADTVINTAEAGDVGLYNARTGWIRIGNFIHGSPALRALITALTERVDANTELLARMSVFEHYEFNPGGIPGTDFPEFIALKCARKIVNKTVQSIAVSLGGQNVGNIVRNVNPVPPATDPAVPFNNGVSELSGGIVNCVLNVQARQNLKNSVGVANGSPQFIGANVTVTFTDGTVMSDLLHFGTNNNAYRGGDVDQTARDAAAAAQATADDATTPGEASEIANGRVSALRAIITNIASFDAAQNRFEDGDGDEVAIPDGADVYLTQAVYDAAVADAEFTPNANATFYTRA